MNPMKIGLILGSSHIQSLHVTIGYTNLDLLSFLICAVKC